jgi:hypothetical protein
MHVTPSQPVFLLLQELSRLTGKPMASMIREMLDEARPALEMMLQALRDMETRPDAMQAAVGRMAAQAHAHIAQATLDLDTNLKPGRKPGKQPGGGAKPR